ncbi:pro-resilin-like [Penaeus monodon]|uniref:pro-resilin-like n=1 Tax=Penaeus monodon TaxID=6687 RepID=UPI0018A75292|nr:pro-resilin-like [Penaeus monodon]
MKQAAVLVILLMAAAAWASEGYHYHPQATHAHKAAHKSARYNYKWEVKDKASRNNYGHEEHRDGALTQGSYFVHLPDSRLMRVDYYVDEYGYHPTITFEGEAKYPSPKDYSAPSKDYSAPSDDYSAPHPPAVSYSPQHYSHHGK